ncbi:methionyl-tRNA synthetase [Moumouvirus australiensis]|uniref:methionine--tRNA ligase n=1 Tax=Moumouvirus australiensis TaxID=2109587 RepID=A0A2P1EMD9_9VIRU|nr:methionyl-tRNA synthetase [Moumouvirus australiensis]AVL95067.1 methionyl-tRNA synthetase [Moumouvirus australiensis]
MKYFITAALPYPNNASPHLGNLIGALLSGDIYARFKRGQGHEVIYLSGTDEYGTTTMIKARQEGLSCRELCDKYFELHKKVYDWFNIEFNTFGRTSTQKQTEITHEIFLGLYNNGYIEEKTISQTFCNKCNMFLADTYVKGICYHDQCKNLSVIANGDQCERCQKLIDVNKLIDPFCGICKSIPEQKITNHLYLKLGDLTPKIREYLDKTNFKTNVDSIARAWLETGLTSRCITRDLSWGTPIPKEVEAILENYENKVFYVWFDAPIGYYSILANHREDWREWLNSDVKWISTQGKDNIPFHTIVFPGSILGSGVNLPLISDICGTDYLLYEGEKFSKSSNKGLFGDKVIKISDQLDINEDYWRYYLIKIRPETGDSSFSLKDFVSCVKSDLVGNIGNLFNRFFVLSSKLNTNEFSANISENILEMIKNYEINMDNFKFREALKICLNLSHYTNKYIQDNRPWKLLESNPKLAYTILGNAGGSCWILLNLLTPFIPKTCSDILSKIETDSDINHLENLVKYKIIGKIDLPFKNINFDEINNLIKNAS